MTREEAIAYGNDYYGDLILACCEVDKRHKEFVKMSLEALKQEPKIIETIDFAINASNGDTNYFVGFRNGLRYAKSLIDGEEEPQFESCIEQEPKTEPCEDCCNGNQIEKAKLCQRSYLAGMEHKQEPKTEWIPVSERLPEDLEPVNITWVNHNPESYYADIKDKPFTATGHYCNGRWWWYSVTCQDYLNEYGRCDVDAMDDDIEVTAWMPLPESYEPQERSEE